MDICLVFTAHPTEIVRHTIRKRQRRLSYILENLDRAEESCRAMGLSNSWEAENCRQALLEEIRLWWYTDELHQFKPTVLDEVDYTLHYFQEVLFDCIPELHRRLQQALKSTFPNLKPPTINSATSAPGLGAIETVTPTSPQKSHGRLPVINAIWYWKSI